MSYGGASLERLTQTQGADYFRNNDDARAADVTDFTRDIARQSQVEARTRGLKEGMVGRYAPARYVHISSGGGLLRKQVYPLINSPALNFDDAASRHVVARPCCGSEVQPPHLPCTSCTDHSASAVVHIGFGRYIPYTEVAAVTSGAWSFLPVFGGLRVALHRGSPLARSADLQTAANLVARFPAKYGYILQNDTYVPARLPPGDRYLLTTSTV